MNTVKYDRDTLLDDLRNNVVGVRFHKVKDGTERYMKCTLREDMLPQNYKYHADVSFHATHPDVLAVWDIEANDWRAFRVDTVSYVEDIDYTKYK